MINTTTQAKFIAAKANECCHRSDGWEEMIEKLALEQLEAAYKRGYDRAFGQYANYKEDMGR